MSESAFTFHRSGVDAPRSIRLEAPQQLEHHRADVLVVGGGAAGLAAALRASQQASVTLLTRGALLASNSARAQGGIAAALDRRDSPAFQVEDTLVAGAGLSDVAAVEALAWAAPELIREMASLGVPFACEEDAFVLGLEGGHRQRRIVHAGDATGWALTSTLAARARACSTIQILEGYQAVDLLGEAGRCTGLVALDDAGCWHAFTAGATILATGGAGALYGFTSNEPGALGEGIALAYRAGAAVADMEFVQFHPTVLRARSGQGFLISEAVRGEGARLYTPRGRRFMPDYDERAELATRDVVTRSIFAAMCDEGATHVLLDVTHLSASELERRFPTIYRRCREENVDLAVEPVPVAPAAHYLMGGVCTDLDGATTVEGLYAAGECACTGVHGANRLASNSLLECLVFGRRAAGAAVEYAARAPHMAQLPLPKADIPAGTRGGIESWRAELTETMRTYAGPLRTEHGLIAACERLDAISAHSGCATSERITAANATLAARLIATSALLREESRGAHQRVDHPETASAWRGHVVLAAGANPRLVQTVSAVVESCGTPEIRT